jgi:hypothetical protein
MSVDQAAQRESVAQCVAAHFARLPESWRTATVYPLAPSSADNGGGGWPWTVSPAMCDGRPAPDGTVRWKLLAIERPYLNYFDHVFPAVGVPPTFEADLHCHRFCRMVVGCPDDAVLRSPTPGHEPDDLLLRFGLEWGARCWSAGFVPFAESAESTHIDSFDRNMRDGEDESPVVQLPAGVLFHLADNSSRSAVACLAQAVTPSLRTLLTDSRLLAEAPGGLRPLVPAGAKPCGRSRQQAVRLGALAGAGSERRESGRRAPGTGRTAPGPDRRQTACFAGRPRLPRSAGVI